MKCISLYNAADNTLNAASERAAVYYVKCIVSTLRQFWKLGAVVRVPGARTRRVRAIKPWCGVVAISQP